MAVSNKEMTSGIVSGTCLLLSIPLFFFLLHLMNPSALQAETGYGYTYSTNGHLEKALTSVGHSFSYSYDARGNVVSISQDTELDTDHDFLPDSLENESTCPNRYDSDSDDDGIADGMEDKNRNGTLDAGETDPCNVDSDGDGIQDGTESGVTDPVADPDGSGPLLGTDTSVFIPDSDPTTQTDPCEADSDGDGVSDGGEDTNHNGHVDPGESNPCPVSSRSISGTVSDQGGGTYTTPVLIKIFAGERCEQLELVQATTTTTTGDYLVEYLPGTSYRVQLEMESDSGMLTQWYHGSGPVYTCNDAEMVSLLQEPDRTNIDFLLQPYAMISGTLYNGTTAPVDEPLQVRVYRNNACTGEQAAVAPVNPADGTFTVRGLLPGSYFLQADVSGSNFLEEYYSTAGDSYQCSQADPVVVNFGDHLSDRTIHLDRGANLSGTIFLEDQLTPMTGETIYLGVYQTDSCTGDIVEQLAVNRYTGTFSTGGLTPGTYFLKVTPLYTSYIAEWWSSESGAYNCSQAETITVDAGDELTGVDFVLDQGGFVAGRIYEQDGATGVSSPVTVEFWRQDYSQSYYGCNSQLITYGTFENGQFSQSLPLVYLPDSDRYLTSRYYMRIVPGVAEYAAGWRTDDNSLHRYCSGAYGTDVDLNDEIDGNDFYLPPGNTIAGNVYQSDGVTPIADPLTVLVPMDDLVDLVGVYDPLTGAYEVNNLMDTSHRLQVSATGTIWATEWWSLAGNSYFEEQAEAITVSGGETVSGKDVLLDRGALISGTLYELDGTTPLHQPVAVWLKREDPCEYVNSALLVVESDELTGKYRFANIGPGTYTLRATFDSDDSLLNEYWSSAGDAFDCTQADPVVVNEGVDVGGLDFRIDMKSTLSGVIYQSDGVTTMNETVRMLLFNGDPCSTDAITGVWINTTNGSFAFQGLPPGAYYLKADTYFHTYASEYWTSSGGSELCSGAQAIIVPSGEDVTDISMVLEEGGIISGQVTNSLGNNVSVSVYLYTGDPCTDNEIQYTSSSYSTGRYTIDALGSGTYYLRVVSDYYREEWWSQAGDARSCSEAEPITLATVGDIYDTADFQVDPLGSISGYLYEIDGQSRVYDCLTVKAFKDQACSGESVAESTACGEGGSMYEITGLEAGNYFLLVDTDEFAKYLSQWWSAAGDARQCTQAETVTVTDGEVIENIDFSLNKKGSITGEVRDSSNSRLDGATVYAYAGTSACTAVETGSDTTNYYGEYETSLPAGTYFLLADDYGYIGQWWKQGGGTTECSEAEPLQVSNNVEIDNINFTLNEANRLKGTVYNRSGSPMSLSPAYVYIYRGASACNGELVGSEERTINNTFWIIDLPPDNYYLRLESDGVIDQWWSSTGNALSCEDAEPILLEGYGETRDDLTFSMYDCGNYPELPVNDNFSGPIILNGSSGDSGSNNFCATSEPGEPSHGGSTAGNTVWWSWTAPSSGRYSFSTEGSFFDTVLAVYTGNAVDALSLIAENDDLDSESWSYLEFDAGQGIVYSLAVAGGEDENNNIDGNIRLNWLSLSAHLHGDLDGDGSITLTDAVIGLQLLTGSTFQPPLAVHKEADLDGDLKIGIAEIIYVLQEVSEE